MRHHNQNRKFGRVRKVRKALINSLARSLVLYEKIETTEEKAKELRPFVEKLITKSKTDSLSTRRFLISIIGPKATKFMFENLAKKFTGRNGGYTRIIKLGSRVSDGAKMAVIEFV